MKDKLMFKNKNEKDERPCFIFAQVSLLSVSGERRAILTSLLDSIFRNIVCRIVNS